MKDIPVEFLPCLWVSQPKGIEGNGSGFLLAENIESIFTIDANVNSAPNQVIKWSLISMTKEEIKRDNYLIALVRLITESWLENKKIMIIGSPWALKTILVRFMMNTGGMKKKGATHTVKSKLG
jgi:hypothetical protein